MTKGRNLAQKYDVEHCYLFASLLLACFHAISSAFLTTFLCGNISGSRHPDSFHSRDSGFLQYWPPGIPIPALSTLADAAPLSLGGGEG